MQAQPSAQQLARQPPAAAALPASDQQQQQQQGHQEEAIDLCADDDEDPWQVPKQPAAPSAASNRNGPYSLADGSAWAVAPECWAADNSGGARSQDLTPLGVPQHLQQPLGDDALGPLEEGGAGAGRGLQIEMERLVGVEVGQGYLVDCKTTTGGIQLHRWGAGDGGVAKVL